MKKRHKFCLEICRRSALALGLWLAAVSLAPAQDSDASSPSGFHVRSFSGFVVYYSNPQATGGLLPGGTNLPSDVAAGGSAEMGWTRYRERTSIAFTYTPSYTGHLQYSGWNAFNQAMSFNVMRKVAPRWTLMLSAAANLSTLDQFLFAPTAFSNAVAIPANFEDLASAMLAGRFNDPRLAPVLGGAQVSQSPLQTLLYGERVLNTSANASLSYSYSPRLSITVGGSGGYSQRLSQDGVPAGNSILENATSENLMAGLSYSLSPRTQIGASVSGARAASPVEDTLTTTSVASIGRKLGTRWFVQLQAGLGMMTSLRTTTLQPLSTSPHPVITGRLGYKTFSHTLLGSYGRTVSDSYGLGATTNSSATASWQWKRPGRNWGLAASFEWQRLAGTLIGDGTGWHSTAGVSRSLGHVVLLMEYAYLSSSGLQQQAPFQSHSVRVSTSWRPNPALFR
jgi:hypothetical protein